MTRPWIDAQMKVSQLTQISTAASRWVTSIRRSATAARSAPVRRRTATVMVTVTRETRIRYPSRVVAGMWPSACQ